MIDVESNYPECGFGEEESRKMKAGRKVK